MVRNYSEDTKDFGGFFSSMYQLLSFRSSLLSLKGEHRTINTYYVII